MGPTHSLTDKIDPFSIVSEYRLEAPTLLYRFVSIYHVAARCVHVDTILTESFPELPWWDG